MGAGLAMTTHIHCSITEQPELFHPMLGFMEKALVGFGLTYDQAKDFCGSVIAIDLKRDVQHNGELVFTRSDADGTFAHTFLTSPQGRVMGVRKERLP
jgi:hypothetical protein